MAYALSPRPSAAAIESTPIGLPSASKSWMSTRANEIQRGLSFLIMPVLWRNPGSFTRARPSLTLTGTVPLDPDPDPEPLADTGTDSAAACSADSALVDVLVDALSRAVDPRELVPLQANSAKRQGTAKAAVFRFMP